MTARVIGVGNRWRGDDAAGLAVAERLGAPKLAGDGTGLLDAWADADHVTIVDAASSGAPAGTVRHLDASATPLPAKLLRSSTHAFGVAEAIELARALGRLPARVDVYAIEGADFTAAGGLSAPVVRAVEELAAKLASQQPGQESEAP